MRTTLDIGPAWAAARHVIAGVGGAGRDEFWLNAVSFEDGELADVATLERGPAERRSDVADLISTGGGA